MEKSPKVTVLMPVFNGEQYLSKAVDSILSQTFRDFELLIINDGSSDRSESIISSYQDSRIRLVSNSSNLGLIETLNKGIMLASGEYIARMDCDDISHPSRLAKQVDFLDSHDDYAMVSAKVRLIDSSSKELGFWLDDYRTTSCEEIMKQLPIANCIAHPAIMIRKNIIEKYGYDQDQSSSEDYDLWLRMAADGRMIGKIDEFLLDYRIHEESLTVLSNKRNSSTKNIRTKATFILKKIKQLQINAFVLRVFMMFLLDIFLLPLKRTRTFLYKTAVKTGLKTEKKHV